MNRASFLIFLVAITFFPSVACETIPTNDPEPDYYDNNREDINDFEVVLHEHSGFRGRQARYALKRGRRHVLVDFVSWGLNDRVSSISCGRRVGVALFRDREFRGPVAVYDRSTDMVDRDINDWASSAIIFDLDGGGPLGVWLGNGGGGRPNVFDVNNFHGQARFYPLGHDYDRINEFNDQAEWLLIGPASRRDYRRTHYRDGGDRRRYARGGYANIEVFVYEHSGMRGRSLALPDRRSPRAFYDLKKMGFSRMISSLAIREVRGRGRR